MQQPQKRRVILTKVFDRSHSKHFSVSACSMQGSRASMEDEHVIIPALPNHPNIAMFAVFDGHGGTWASEYLLNHLPEAIDALDSEKIRNDKEIEKTILEMDELYCKSFCSGSTIALTLVETKKKDTVNEEKSESENYVYDIRVFWAGDSRVVVGEFASDHRFETPKTSPMGDDGREQLEDNFLDFLLKEEKVPTMRMPLDLTGKVRPELLDKFESNSKSFHFTTLTKDHCPQEESERERIESCGSFVFNGRVDGCLAVSRAFGDREYKRRPVSWKDQPVSGVCEVSKWTIDPNEGDVEGNNKIPWMLLYCDGLVEGLTNAQLISTLHAEYRASRCGIFTHSKDPVYAIGNLCDTALMFSGDNLTAIFVQFQSPNEIIPDFGNGKSILPCLDIDSRQRLQLRDCPHLKRADLMQQLRLVTTNHICAAIRTCYMAENAPKRTGRLCEGTGVSQGIKDDMLRMLRELEEQENEERGTMSGRQLTPMDDAWRHVRIPFEVPDMKEEAPKPSKTSIGKKRRICDMIDAETSDSEPCEKKRRIDRTGADDTPKPVSLPTSISSSPR